MNVRWSPFATMSLKEINTYRKETGGLKSARKIRKKIFEATSRLKSFPKLGKEVEKPRFKKLGIRFIIESHFKIFYRIFEDENEIEILNVSDTRKDPNDSPF